MNPRRRLVAFLGLGSKQGDGSFRYSQANYLPSDSLKDWLCDEVVTTEFMPIALATLGRVDEVVVLATVQAWRLHGDALLAQAHDRGLPTPSHRELPDGETPDQLWRQFEVVKEALRFGGEVLLDVTLGYRAQPVFAAAAVSFVRSVDPNPAPIRMAYGAYDASQKGRTRLWDLTPFIDLLDWSQGLMLFLRTGRAEDISTPVLRMGEALRSDWARAGMQGPQPALDGLGKALEAFGNDLVTVRVKSLAVNGRKTGSATRLAERIDAARVQVQRSIPPLADVLERILDRVRPLAAADLTSEEGARALAALARTYLDMGRYAEAVAVVREAWVTRFTASGDEFDRKARERATRAWFAARRDMARTVATVRNDVEHAGFSDSPQASRSLIKAAGDLCRDLEKTAGQPTPRGKPAPGTGVFVNLSNHPLATWTPAQVDAARQLGTHLEDLPFPSVPPDADLDAIENLAAETLKKLPTGTAHVMVAGEPCLATALVRELQGQGIRCWSATNARDTDDLGDGTKLARFRFVQFREFPRITWD